MKLIRLLNNWCLDAIALFAVVWVMFCLMTQGRSVEAVLLDIDQHYPNEYTTVDDAYAIDRGTEER